MEWIRKCGDNSAIKKTACGLWLKWVIKNLRSPIASQFIVSGFDEPGRVRYINSSWNVKFAERVVSEEHRYSSRAMTSCSFAMPVCLDCGRKGFITVKSDINIVLMVICGKAAL